MYMMETWWKNMMGTWCLSSLPGNQVMIGYSWSARRTDKTIKVKEESNYQNNDFARNIQILQKEALRHGST